MLLLLVIFGLVTSTILAPKRQDPIRREFAPDISSMQACREMARNDLLSCFSQLVDTNKDGSLDLGEISAFLNAQNIPAQTVLMRLCDIDQDNALTMSDWNSSQACAQSQPIITRACYICVRAGWNPLATTTTVESTTTVEPTTAPAKRH